MAHLDAATGFAEALVAPIMNDIKSNLLKMQFEQKLSLMETMWKAEEFDDKSDDAYGVGKRVSVFGDRNVDDSVVGDAMHQRPAAEHANMESLRLTELAHDQDQESVSASALPDTRDAMFDEVYGDSNVDDSVVGDAMQQRLAAKMATMETLRLKKELVHGKEAESDAFASACINTDTEIFMAPRLVPCTDQLVHSMATQHALTEAAGVRKHTLGRTRAPMTQTLRGCKKSASAKHSRGSWILMEDEESKVELSSIGESYLQE